MNIISKAKEKTSKQDYSSQEIIEGVRVVELKRFTGEDGSFNELVRLEGGKVVQPEEVKRFEIKQINHSRVVPGTVKAWHWHKDQDEIWFIHPESKVIVGLLDIREESKTSKKFMKLSLGDGRAHLVYIPKGVAHGLSNPYNKDATMTYLVNSHFEMEDELRLPFDFIVGDDFWELEEG